MRKILQDVGEILLFFSFLLLSLQFRHADWITNVYLGSWLWCLTHARPLIGEQRESRGCQDNQEGITQCFLNMNEINV